MAGESEIESRLKKMGAGANRDFKRWKKLELECGNALGEEDLARLRADIAAVEPYTYFASAAFRASFVESLKICLGDGEDEDDALDDALDFALWDLWHQVNETIGPPLVK
jgi:hypothetical protein